MPREAFNLRHASFKQTLLEAKEVAKEKFAPRGIKVTNQFIANRSGLDAPSVARYFSEHDDYLPSPEKLPALCRALENTLLADWAQAQVEDMQSAAPLTGVITLGQAALQATENTGKLAAKVNAVLADGQVDQGEALWVQGRVRENIKYLETLDASLDAIASGKAGQGGK